MSHLVRFIVAAMNHRLGRFVWVIVFLGAEAGAQVPYYRATKLPDFPASWVQGWTLGVSLNDAGQVAGLTQMGMAVGWSFANGLVPLAGDGQALGVAAGLGAMVGWSRGANGRTQAAAWSFPGGGTSFLSDLYAGVPAYESIAHAVNNAGWVLISARASIDDPYRLMLLRPGESALDLGESATGLYWEGGAANGIVGGNILLPGRVARGVVWTEAQGIRSFSVNGGDTFIEGVNANGWAVGRTMLKDAQGITQAQGFVHDAIADQTLFGWMNFWPRDINNSGMVVGILRDTGTYQRISAAAWTSGEVVDLNTRTANLGFYELYQAVGVNAQGQILAFGGPSGPGSASRPLDTLGLATFLLSECLRCGQITPNPNPSGALLDVDLDWFDAFNAQDYRNLGTLKVGTTLLNRAGAVLRNAGDLDIYGHAGNLIQAGQLVNEASGRIVVDNTLVHTRGALTTNAGFVTIGAFGEMVNMSDARWLDQPGATFVQVAGKVTWWGSWLADRSTFEQRGGEFTTGLTSHLELASATASVGGTLIVLGRMEVLPNLAATPNQASTLRVTGKVGIGPGGTLINARSLIDVDGGRLENVLGLLDLANDSRTTVRAGGELLLDSGVTRVRNRALLEILGAGSKLTLRTGATLNLDSDLVLRDGAELINAGTMTISGRSSLTGDDSLLRSSGSIVTQRDTIVVVRGAGAALHIEPAASPGAAFTNAGLLLMGDDTVLNVAGAVINTGAIDLGTGARLRVDGGNLRVARGATIRGGEFVQESGATFVDGLIDQPYVFFYGGSVAGSGTIRGNTVFGIGVTHAESLRVRAGSSPGTLTIDGDLTIDNARMELEVGDFRRYDRLVVTGNLQLGQFSAVLLPEAGYAPDLNDRFDWLSAGSILGDLSAVTLDASALGGGWTAQGGTGGSGARITLDNAAATSWGPDLIDAGTTFLVNPGEITRIDSFRSVMSRADVEVRGFVAVRNDASLSIQGGTFTVAAGGRLTSRGYLTHAGDAFVNAGLLRNYDDGSVSMYGPFNNRGVVENAGSWEQVGRFENEAAGRVVNHGTILSRYGPGIVNRGRFENYGVIENGGFITNTEGGVFIVAAGAVVRSSGSGLDSYRDFGGTTRVDGRLAASEIWFQGGATVLGSGVLVGPVTGDARFELRPADTLAIEGGLTGYHSFDVWIDGANAFGYLTVSGGVILQGGMLRFLLTDGGYVPQAGDSFRWLRAGGSASGFETLVLRIDVRVPGENGFDYPWAIPGGLLVSLHGDTLTVAAVPEPRAYSALLAGLALVAIWARRRTDVVKRRLR